MHYLHGRIRCSVESIVEEVGLSQLLSRNLVGLSLGLLARLAAAVATLASASTAGFSRLLYDNLLFWLGRRTLFLLLLSKPCLSSCPGPSCSCGSSSGCSNPDSFQASKSSSLSFGLAGVSQSYKLCSSLLLKSQVSHADRPKSTKCFSIGPGILRDADVFEPALTPSPCHILSCYGFHSPVILGSDLHNVLPIGPPGKVRCSPGKPLLFECNSPVSFTDRICSGNFLSPKMSDPSQSSVSDCRLSSANDPSSLKGVGGS